MRQLRNEEQRDERNEAPWITDATNRHHQLPLRQLHTNNPVGAQYFAPTSTACIASPELNRQETTSHVKSQTHQNQAAQSKTKPSETASCGKVHASEPLKASAAWTWKAVQQERRRRSLVDAGINRTSTGHQQTLTVCVIIRIYRKKSVKATPFVVAY